MELTTGINHVAVLTRDLDRFADFYCAVLGADVIFDATEPVIGRHAMLRIGTDSVLHAIEAPDSPHAKASPALMDRGHLDHLGINVPTFEALLEIRGRLVAHGATDGTITDFGPMQSVWFEDPDGMGCEVCYISDPSLSGIHGPQPYAESVS